MAAPRTRSLLLTAAFLLAGCTAGSLLGPEAPQGVQGTVLIGPQCPVAIASDPCPDLPFEATLDIWDDGGSYITRVRSGPDGRFRVGLLAGDYLIEPESGTPFPWAGAIEVRVDDGRWSEVTVHYDTGIR